MKSKLALDGKLAPTWLIFLIITVLLLGIFFRFTNLDQKIYWGDESHTSLWISGHTSLDVMENVLDGRVFTIDELHKYQRLNPDKGFSDTINALATEYPLHPPLYYALVRLWAQWFGDSIATLRSFSAVASLLALPSVYWLCLELFQSSLAGWVAIALVAISPYQLLYAQEAREYGLWAGTILLTSAALLRAIRTNTPLSWGVYAITLALSLYTFVFSILVAIGHGVYVFISQSWRSSKTVFAYLLASLAGFLLFAPWLLRIVEFSRDHEEGWLNQPVSPVAIAQRWVGILSRTFLDVGTDSSDSFDRVLPLVLPVLLLLGLIAYSFYFLCRTTPKPVWLFVLTLTVITPLILTLRDFKNGGILATTPRYLFPCFLGIQLAVAYLLATKIALARQWQQPAWKLGLIAVLSSGILSGAISAQADTWWNKGSSLTKYTRQTAHIINQTQAPLTIAYISEWQVMTLSYMLEPKVRLQRPPEPVIPTIPNGFSDLFLFDPSQKLKTQFEQNPNYQLELVYKPGSLWRIKKPKLK